MLLRRRRRRHEPGTLSVKWGKFIGRMVHLGELTAQVAPMFILPALARVRVLSAKEPEGEPVEVPLHRCKAMYWLREDVPLVGVDDELHRRSLLPQRTEHL